MPAPTTQRQQAVQTGLLPNAGMWIILILAAFGLTYMLGSVLRIAFFSIAFVLILIATIGLFVWLHNTGHRIALGYAVYRGTANVRTPAPASSNKLQKLLLKIVLGVAAVVALLLLVPHLVDIAAWPVNTVLHAFGDKTVDRVPATPPSAPRTKAKPVPPRASSEPSESEVRAKALAQRQEIENEEHPPITLNYGDKMLWIKVPKGGFITDFTVDGNKLVGVQCGSSPDQPPPLDATGPEFECLKGISSYWVRFYAWSADEGPVTIHHRFRYAF